MTDPIVIFAGAVLLISLVALIFTMFFVHRAFRRGFRHSENTVKLLKDAVLSNIQTIEDAKAKNDRIDQLIEIIQHNSEAMTAIRMAVEQHSQMLERLAIEQNARFSTLSQLLRVEPDRPLQEKGAV